MAANKRKLPTPAEIRARITQAEERVSQAAGRFAQLAFEKIGNPEMDTWPAVTELEDAKAELGSLQAALPLAEKADAADLEETRERLAADRRQRLHRELRAMVTAGMQFSAHYGNAVSAFRRAVANVDRARDLLPDELRQRGRGWERKLTGSWVRQQCLLEINRLGLLPIEARTGLDGMLDAPGARGDNMDLRYVGAPHTIPALELVAKRLVADLMAAATPSEKAQESEGATDSPKVAAEPQRVSTASAVDLTAAGRTEETA